VDQATSDSTVPVNEWVDRLKLSMGDGRLGDGRQVVSVDEDCQVIDEALDLGFRRRDVPGVDWVVEVTADPVLLPPKLTGPGLCITRHQCAVDSQDVFPCHRTLGLAKRDGLFHRHDVGRDRSRRALGGTRVNQGSREVSLRKLMPFDPRRRDRLRTQQKRPDGLESLDAGVVVQGHHRCLGGHDLLMGLERDRRVDRGDWVGDERLIRKGSPGSPSAVGTGVAFPSSVHKHSQTVNSPATLTC